MSNTQIAIKDLPEYERPRERLLTKGAAALSLSELISVMLGKGVKGHSINVVSENIVAMYGGVKSLPRVSVQDLLAIKGVGVAKACQLTACFELARRMSGDPIIKSKTYRSSEQIYSLVRPYFLDKEKEHFLVVTLDTRRRLIAMDNISIGSMDRAIADPREVFKTAINRRASYIALVHNHPSGDSTPSADDITVTDRLMNVSRTIGIPIVDHLIVSDSGYTSLRNEEYISELLE